MSLPAIILTHDFEIKEAGLRLLEGEQIFRRVCIVDIVEAGELIVGEGMRVLSGGTGAWKVTFLMILNRFKVGD
jgi:hypothetical protein